MDIILKCPVIIHNVIAMELRPLGSKVIDSTRGGGGECWESSTVFR